MFFLMVLYHVRDRVSIIHDVNNGDAVPYRRPLTGLVKKTPDAPAKDRL